MEYGCITPEQYGNVAENGHKDTQVPIIHSEIMLTALRDSGKNAEMFRETGGGHGNMKGPGWENGEAVLFEFLARNL
ncbi:MAG: prolyl oligopeptidase family serine peptidase [Gammaproteobacteria bacterium]|nr:prolyl oligopeptidase family serine peptidase [Gammaproteobacteria bacterium]